MIDVSQVIELVENSAYPAMFESYGQAPAVYPQICEVVTPEEAGTPLYGDKGSEFQSVEGHRKMLDGQDFDDSTLDRGWTWQAAIHPYGGSITIPRRLRDANALTGRMKADLVRAARSWGKSAIIEKDDIVAGMFQKGTLTAGSTLYFDGSFPQNSDSNRGFIYDGLPWFDGAHTLSGSSSTFSNISTSLALTSANLQTALNTMRVTNAVDERGKRVMITPDIMVVPGGMEFTALTVMESVLLPGSANNDANVVRGSLARGVLSWNALSDAASASAWWIGQAGQGIRCYDSGAPVIEVKEKENGDIVVQSRYYFGAAVTNWRYWYAANKADS